MTPDHAIDRAIGNDLAAASRREWLVTNGIGGYAAGTVAGLHTRRYHGLLVAALAPPLGRTVVASKLEEIVRYAGRNQPLATNRWADGTVAPRGFEALDSFSLDATTPVWRFAVADALVEKRVWMEPGANTTYVRYTILRATAPVELELTALVTHRDYHATSHAGHGGHEGDEWTMAVAREEEGLRIDAYEGAAPVFVRSSQGSWIPQHSWYRGMKLEREAERGLDDLEDVLRIGTLTVTLTEGEHLLVSISTRADHRPDPQALHRRQAHEQQVLAGAAQPDDPVIRRLVLAADQFIVARPTPRDPEGISVIAGYPWFGDWGRDTMIALPGLTLETGRPALGARIMRTFASFIDEGMLPNRFPDAGEQPEYNTADATLWLFEALRRHLEANPNEGQDQGPNDALVDELWPALEQIIAWHHRGTRYGIQMDPTDHLLRAGEAGVQLTWMDAKIGDWVVTPRIGKPIEINALWLGALELMAALAGGTRTSSIDYRALADGARRGMQRFWCPERGFCYDVLDGPDGDDASLRPNQLLAVALPHCPFDPAQQRAIVDVCVRELYTPLGVRSLGPREPGYAGRYVGGPRERDAVYHQGTAWAWLVGPLCRAHLRVYRDPTRMQQLLAPLVRSLGAHGLGTLAEIFDGDPPHTPRGCFAQAWSVSELLSSLNLLHRARADLQADHGR